LITTTFGVIVLAICVLLLLFFLEPKVPHC
jgi:hypothetical protein